MRCLFLALACISNAAWAQLPDKGFFRYALYDSSDRSVGTYWFTIEKVENGWRVTSEMDIDTTVFLLKVKLLDRNMFVFDGRNFRSFSVSYYKDVPFLKTVEQKVEGQRDGNLWRIVSLQNGKRSEKVLAYDAFEEIRNLVSRAIRPETILQPGKTRSARSLDPLTLEVGTVVSRGLREETVKFQGKQRRVFVIEQKAPDGDVVVNKFDNGLIYRSQTANGYALLLSAELGSF